MPILFKLHCFYDLIELSHRYCLHETFFQFIEFTLILVSWIKSVSWEYSCVEEYFVKFHKWFFWNILLINCCTPMKLTWSHLSTHITRPTMRQSQDTVNRFINFPFLYQFVVLTRIGDSLHHTVCLYVTRSGYHSKLIHRLSKFILSLLTNI